MNKFKTFHEDLMKLVKDDKKIKLFLKTEMLMLLYSIIILIMDVIFYQLQDLSMEKFFFFATINTAILAFSGIVVTFFLWKLYTSLLKKPYRYNNTAKWYFILSYGVFSQGVCMALLNINSKNYAVFGYTFHFLLWMGTFGVFMGYFTWTGINFSKLQEIAENNA